MMGVQKSSRPEQEISKYELTHTMINCIVHNNHRILQIRKKIC